VVLFFRRPVPWGGGDQGSPASREATNARGPHGHSSQSSDDRRRRDHGLGSTATVSGTSIHTVGVILIVIGAVGLVLSIVFWSSWGGFGGANRVESSTTVVKH
jgi:hypothetical protein